MTKMCIIFFPKKIGEQGKEKNTQKGRVASGAGFAANPPAQPAPQTRIARAANLRR